MGESMKSYSTIRWWSRFDLMEQLAHGFPCLDQLITVLEERGIAASVTPPRRTSARSTTPSLQPQPQP